MTNQLLIQLLQEILSAVGIAGASLLVAILKKYNGSAKMKKIQAEIQTHQDLAKGVVLAVQQIYSNLSNSGKLNIAIKMLSDKLDNAGIKMSADDVHSLIESTLISAKKEFQDQWNQATQTPVVNPAPEQPVNPVVVNSDPMGKTDATQDVQNAVNQAAQ